MGQRMQRGVERLPHAAVARHVNERPGRELAQREPRLGSQRVVGTAHEMEAISAQACGQSGR
jgi:hypothetical protein